MYWFSLLENNNNIPQNLEIEFPFDQVLHFLKFTQGLTNTMEKGHFPSLFLASLSTITKFLEQETESIWSDKDKW